MKKFQREKEKKKIWRCEFLSDERIKERRRKKKDWRKRKRKALEFIHCFDVTKYEIDCENLFELSLFSFSIESKFEKDSMNFY